MSEATSEPSVDDPAACLRPSRFIDSDSPEVVAYARRAAGAASDEAEAARRLYLAVRDDLRYDPYRLGFADVRNHLTSPKLKKLMGTDVFAFHGYTELHLAGRWVKATPAFNLSLCERASILPLEFDGENDSIYHPFDAEGRRHMEYVRYRGVYLDIPFAEMMRCFAETYGMTAARMALEARRAGDFEREVTAPS